MSKFKFAALISLVCLMSTLLYGLAGFSQSPQPFVQLTTNPPVSQIFPFEAESIGLQSPLGLRLQAMDAAGKPLKNALMALSILTPPKNPWLTTDFPVVEGTKLLEIEALAPKGELLLQQMLPIRGTYQLRVHVTPLVANAFTPIQQTLTLSVPENWVKYRNFGILAVILLSVGLGGGLAIGGRQAIQPGEIAPQRVRLLLSGAIIVAIAALLVVNISAEMAQLEMSMPMSHISKPVPHPNNLGIVQSQGLEARLSGVSAKVGSPVNLQVKVIDTKTNQPATEVILKVKTTQIEHGWVAFTYEGVPDTRGQLAWQEQFFDGAPHKVEVEISPQPNAARPFPPIAVEREIEVEGVAPPLLVRLTSLAYFTGIVTVGLLLGLALRRSRLQQAGQN